VVLSPARGAFCRLPGIACLTYSQIANFIESEAALHVISRKRLLEALHVPGDLGAPLDVWYRIAKQAAWKSLDDVRQTFPSADGVGTHTVFNIKGNTCRLIVEINFITGRVSIKHALTHAEFDKGAWKI